jgi:Calcineurin-like phosphoesterase
VRAAIGAVVSLLAVAGARGADKAAPAADKEPSFTVVAIGDTGSRNLDLFRNAMGINAVIRSDKDRHALVFLGDNFYEQGLSDETDRTRDLRFKQVYGSWFAESFGELQMSKGRTVAALTSAPGPEGPAADKAKDKPARVHALTGNHDYYSKEAAREVLHALPVGFTTSGNAYAKTRLEWVYHYGEPEDVVWDIPGPTAEGRRRVQLVFLDSSLLVRSDWTQTECKAVPLPPRVGDWLGCGFRAHTREKLVELLKKYPEADVWRVLVTHHPLDTMGYHRGARWMPERGGVVLQDLCSKAEQPIGWLRNDFDPEDWCTTGWQKYVCFVNDAIAEAGVDVHVALAGHDHSLQLLDLSDGLSGFHGPRTQIISGAGSKTTVVSEPCIDRPFFTAYRPEPKARGVSESGWATLTFTKDRVVVQYFSGRTEITGRMGAPASLCLDARGKFDRNLCPATGGGR